MEFLKLKNNYEITIEDGASLGNIVHIAATEAAALEVCAQLTPENIESVTFLSNGQVTGVYEHLTFAAPVYREIIENGVSVIISLREKTSLELDVEAIQAEQEIQNEAIDYLAMQ